MPAKQTCSNQVNIHIHMDAPSKPDGECPNPLRISVADAMLGEPGFTTDMAASRHPMAAHLHLLHTLENELCLTLTHRRMTAERREIMLEMGQTRLRIWWHLLYTTQPTIGPISDEVAFKHPIATELRALSRLIKQFLATNPTTAQDALLRALYRTRGHIWDILLYGDLLAPADPTATRFTVN